MSRVDLFAIFLVKVSWLKALLWKHARETYLKYLSGYEPGGPHITPATYLFPYAAGRIVAASLWLHIYIHIPIYLSIYLSIYIYIYLSLSLFLSFSLSPSLYACIYIHTYIYMPGYPSPSTKKSKLGYGPLLVPNKGAYSGPWVNVLWGHNSTCLAAQNLACILWLAWPSDPS